MNRHDAEVERKYYSDLVSAVGANVVVKNLGPRYGRVVCATREFKRGELMWRERPLLAMQDSASCTDRFVVRACGFCLRTLGSLEEQAAHYAALLGSNAFPEYVGATRCRHRCGELYCSRACQQSAWERHHRLLCVGPLSSNEHELVRVCRVLRACCVVCLLGFADSVCAHSRRNRRCSSSGSQSTGVTCTCLRHSVSVRSCAPQSMRNARSRRHGNRLICFTIGIAHARCSLSIHRYKHSFRTHVHNAVAGKM